MNSLARDLRHGARLLWKAPGFSTVALAALALGMGATSAIFSVVDAVLLKPLPFRDPQRLVVIWVPTPPEPEGDVRHTGRLSGVAQPEPHHRIPGCRSGCLHQPDRRTERPHRSGRAARGARLGESVSAAGSAAGDGARIPAEEDQPGRTSYALLSYSLWQRRFGGDLSIAGKAIRLRDRSYTVTGVLPAGFSLLDAAVDIWIPLGLDRTTRAPRRCAS